jgi:hypothetical protein
MLTGKPDGSEAITVVFTIEAWRTFDGTLGPNTEVRGSSVQLDCPVKPIFTGDKYEHARSTRLDGRCDQHPES